MPAERVSMRKIREALRLTHALGMSRRLVGEATGIGKTAVGEYVRRAAVAGLSWPIPDEIDDAELERRLFPPAAAGSSAARTDPDWSHIHTEMKRRGVTLALLWQEYRGEHAQGYAYSWFCERYSDWRKRITPTMRQTHVAGEKLFVDWAGDAIAVFDPITGAEHGARIFVAALGASNYTYAEARWTETLPDWIGAHVNALSAIGGVPKAAVCDNLKAGITKPSRYEPGINRTYQDMGDHYGFVVLPTRVRTGRHARLLKTLSRVELLILDDWGLATVTLEQARDILEIVDDRHNRGSTIVTTQLPIDHWHEMIPNPTIADAILDRLVHNAHRLTLKGESMRKTAANRADF